MDAKLILKYPCAVKRLVALIAVIVGFVMIYGVRRTHRRDAQNKARWLQSACQQVLRVLAVKVESRGSPAPGVVIVANHLSYLDILVVAALTPVVFVSKKEVRRWPVFGWFAEKAGTRFIDRNRRGDITRITAELGPLLAKGLTIVIFLEGTTTSGNAILPFKASLLEPAVRHGWRVLPAAINYDVPLGRSVADEVCWWGEMTLAPHLWNLITLPWVRARVGWGEPLIAGGARKELAVALHARVVTLKHEHRFARVEETKTPDDLLLVS